MALEGQQLGQYRLLRLLGSGGMGEVYLAEDARINQQVAIKVSRTEGGSYPNTDASIDMARLFQREAKAIARLDHSRILPLFAYGEERVNGILLTYIVMPFRREGSFADWLQRRATSRLLSEQDVAYFIRQAADALQCAHDNQIVHQDVKPSNFLIRSNTENPDHPDLLLADFGIAKLASSTTNMSNTIRGTPNYMAPEQWSSVPVPATDQYALAVMAYELLTGQLPFRGRQEQVMYQHFNVQPQPPSSLNPRLSPGVDNVMLRALAKRPEDRFASISEFARALEQELRRGPMIVPPSPPGRETRNDDSDLRVTLAISPAEAKAGTRRTLTLPGGRQITVSVPANAHEGQILHLAGLGQPAPSSRGGPAGALILNLTIVQAEEASSASAPSIADRSSTEQTALSLSSNPLQRQGTQTPAFSSIASNNITTTSRPALSKGRLFVLVGLAFLVVILILGTFLFIGKQQADTNNANATATAQVHNANATAAANANATANAAATAIVLAANSYPPINATLVVNDPLSDNSHGENWDTTNDSNGSCIFTGGAYHDISKAGGYFYPCFAHNTNYTNFVYEVQMKIIKGDCGALLFRADGARIKYYYFRICQDGSYALFLYVDSTGSHNSTLISPNPNAAIHAGLNQSNLIAVDVEGSTIKLYVNHQKIDSIDDSTYSHGQIGFTADGFVTNHPTEVVYSNLRIWTV